MFTVSPLIIPSYLNFCSRNEYFGCCYRQRLGLTMPGVSVSVKGTTTGTITDIDGKIQPQCAKKGQPFFSLLSDIQQKK